MPLELTSSISPPFKWAGGKRWLAARYPQLFPTCFGTYYEPFLGGGAVFFALRPNRSIISDVNVDLVGTYRAIQSDWSAVQKGLRARASLHSTEYYYRTRSNKPTDDTRRASWLLYMNRACYNGLYRVNKKGEFNVPKGTKEKIVFEYDNFEAVADLLSRAEIHCWDFEEAVDRSGSGDFVYLDPPYTVRHDTNGFLKYNENIFSWSDQERLARSVARAASRGAMLLVSNANHRSVKELYHNLGVIVEIERQSVIGGGNEYRSTAKEVAIKVGY